jgi:Rrf2 family transcriptional regulator, iron-sulfur cluster assembly transcription factor
VLVTREADYAIRCVIEVVRHGRISAAQVAELQGISPTFLGKIVQSLAKAGILATRRGVGGGIALGVPVESLTLLQVIEAVEGPICLNECLTTPPQCSHVETCPAYPFLKQAQVSLRDILDVSFAEVMERLPQPAILDMAQLPTWSPNGDRNARRVARAGDAP